VKQPLSYSQRLHHREDFEAALKKKAISEKWLAVHLELNTKGTDRLGIIVTKRIISKAVARNKIKRQIREVFRTSRFSQTGAFDIVVRLRKNVLANETQEFRRTLSYLLMKARKTENDASAPNVHKDLSVSD